MDFICQIATSFQIRIFKHSHFSVFSSFVLNQKECNNKHSNTNINQSLNRSPRKSNHSDFPQLFLGNFSSTTTMNPKIQTSPKLCTRVLSDDHHRAFVAKYQEDFMTNQVKKAFRQLNQCTSPLVGCSENVRKLYPSALANDSHNRYSNVLPEEHTRVKLQRKELSNNCDYINANFIECSKLGCQSKFIACQAPLPCSFGNFWQMVFEQKVPVICMLTKLEENGRKKADVYWPTEQNKPVFYGSFLVELVSTKKRPFIDVRILKVTFANECHEVIHLHFTEWLDFKTPDMKAFKELLRLAELYADFGKSKNLGGPIVSHCSAGIGRGGVFIAISFLLEQIKKGKEPQIVATVSIMRRQRNGMVQTESQFAFIYQVLDEYLQNQAKKISVIGKSVSLDCDVVSKRQAIDLRSANNNIRRPNSTTPPPQTEDEINTRDSSKKMFLATSSSSSDLDNTLIDNPSKMRGMYNNTPCGTKMEDAFTPPAKRKLHHSYAEFLAVSQS